MLVDWLIERAKRTPYWHLDGYMNRWWLVPYRTVVKRKLPQQPGDYEIGSWDGVHPEAFETADGTGPVAFKSRPIAWLIQRCGIAIRVHEILRSDTERHPHSHPWSYLTILLRGNYAEERYDADGEMVSYEIHKPGSILWRPAGSLHRLTLPQGTVTTLFITFKKRGTWGFQVDGKIVPHKEYLK